MDEGLKNIHDRFGQGTCFTYRTYLNLLSWNSGGVSSLTADKDNSLEIKLLGLGSMLFCFCTTLHFYGLLEIR